jgi:hypothetical protein
VYTKLVRIKKEAEKAGRKFVIAGDFNAVLGERPGESFAEVAGKFGLGVTNERGRRVLQWALTEELRVANTFFKKVHDKRWTHVNGGRKRQIDFVSVDSKVWRWVTNAEACADIGLGNDHQAVKLELTLGERVNGRRGRGRAKRASTWGWQPDDRQEYAEMLDTAVVEGQEKEVDEAGGQSLQEKCEALEEIVRTVAEKCKKAKEETRTSGDASAEAKLKELIARRREERGKVDKTERGVAELSKLIQRQVRKVLRARKRSRIARILEEFRGLRHIADARSHQVRKKLSSVYDLKGDLQTGRQGVVDAFAEFYEALYSSSVEKGEKTRNQRRKMEEVPKVTPEEVEEQLKKMSRKKAGDQAGIVAEMLKDGGPRLREAMADVFTDILCAQSEPPASWRETKLKVLFKKGEQRCLENYRPISIVPILYKVFSRILDARLRKHIAGEQSPDQAGFRPGFGCEDHLFAMAMLGEKCSEFNMRV